MRSRLVVGNWKMHGSMAMVSELLEALKAEFQGAASVETAVAAPYPYLHQASALLSGTGIGLSSQDVSAYPGLGAYTGEVSADMLRDVGCDYVIIGHSERRSYQCETDELLAQKVASAVSAGLQPILCVGETLEQREAGETLGLVTEQLKAVLDAAPEALHSVVVAYEPVWAIGTGKTASPEQAQEVHASLRDCLAGYGADVAARTRILYGGSVKAANAAELFAQQDIDGGLVGGASLDAVEFAAICRVVD